MQIIHGVIDMDNTELASTRPSEIDAVILEMFVDGGFKRKRTRLTQQLKSCECCGYPISQRHHPFGFHKYGEHSPTLQLCPNCHNLYHIVEKALIQERETAMQKFDVLAQYIQLRARILFCLHYIDQIHKTSFKATCERIWATQPNKEQGA